MTMAEKDTGKIFRAPAGVSIAGLRKTAADEARPKDLASEFRDYAETQREITQAFQDEAIDFRQLILLSQKEVSELVESTRRLTPEEERERWTDAEYDQEFYTRFQPNQEPLFYSRMDTEERRTCDARWQLARAAFVKKATANFPDKAQENQDLTLLGKEQMERLYNIEGVKQMMEGYVAAIIGKETPRGNRGFPAFVVGNDLGTGESVEKTFWEITDAAEFENFRKGLRARSIGSLELNALGEKEADAVAWNLIWVSNLVESADSRYSFSGVSHGKLPGVICAGEYRHSLHPQERFENKCVSGHYWGVFGTWGVNQLDKIKEETTRLYGSRNEFTFVPAPKKRYWEYEKTGETSSKGGQVIRIYAPECYPLAPAKSFLEETTVEVDGKALTLLEMLKRGQEIPWKDAKLAEDMWGIYVAGKFNKAVKLLSYFEGDEKLALEEEKERSWTFPILELYTRLKIEDKLEALAREGKTYQTFHNFKVWTIIAGRMGVRKYEEGKVTSPLRFANKGIFEYRLSHPNLGRFLDKGEKIDIN
jgi:hypothetical protein